MTKKLKTAASLPHEKLRMRIDPSSLPFKSTTELKPYPATFGQERALEALRLGLAIQGKGFNIFLMGEPGTGKTSIINNILREEAQKFPTPSDWCYLYNFDDPDQPIAMEMPPGAGKRFKADMAEMIAEAKRDIPKVRESEMYLQHKQSLERSFRKKEQALFNKLRRKAKKSGLDLGLAEGELTLQIMENGNPLGMEEIESLPASKKNEFEKRIIEFQDEIDDYIREQRKLGKVREDRFEDLEKENVLKVCEDNLKEMCRKYGSIAGMEDFLCRVKQELPGRVINYLAKSEQSNEPNPFAAFESAARQDDDLLPFEVNLFVSNEKTKGAPVAFESNPTYSNLIGRLEYKEQSGWLSTDFTQIKPGVLHSTNGGFLVIQAGDLLTNPYSWDALKRSLRTKEIRIQEPFAEQHGRALKTLRPQRIPLNVKVIIVGSYQTFYWLWSMDEDFQRLFKIRADFDVSMPINIPNLLKYARFIAKVCKEENKLPLSAGGFARLIEEGTRHSGHQDRVSISLSGIIDILLESDFAARATGGEVIEAEHVEKAIAARERRESRVQEEFERQIRDGEILIDTRGLEVGQINGIAVYELGDYAFGVPSRITARAYTGRQGIINIDRESDMAGPIHNKATLIIQGLLGGLFAQETPLSLAVSITFEQMYGMVEGDSATCAEFFAILSAISEIPINQGVAITGSLNQRGEVQPIGGVNEKIEGVFRVCKAQGLTGKQGVIIPQQNARHLCLAYEVVEAVKAGKFHIYPIRYIEDGVPILMGVEAGRKVKGEFRPKNGLYARVAEKLKVTNDKLNASPDRNDDE